MRPQIIKSSQVEKEKYGAISVQRLFNNLKSDNVSISIIDLDGTNRKTINRKCNCYYFILKGKGYFSLDGKKYNVAEGDLVIIPKGTAYFDDGCMIMLNVSNPRFTLDQVKEVI